MKEEMGDAAVGELLVMLGWKSKKRKPKTGTP
jgi:hypothetical protein